MLRPGGEHQQQLGGVVHGLRAGVEQHLADPFGQIGAAGLAGHGHGDAGFAQALGEPRQVGTFAGALAAFQRDKTPAHGRGSGLER